MKFDRRQFVKLTTGGVVGVVFTSKGLRLFAQPDPDLVLDPGAIPKYAAPLVIPPAMPQTYRPAMARYADYYEIAIRQFEQQILPPGYAKTTVWSYGSVNHPGTFNYPSFTIEAKWNRTTRVRWINGLMDEQGNYLPHLLPIDQTVHWANPPGGIAGRDMEGTDQTPYTGPVPMVTHVHGAHTEQQSDGYPEAWYLPNAKNIPAGYARNGTYYDIFRNPSRNLLGAFWRRGNSLYEYHNDQRATTLWFHDHSLGITRLNVYAGPAGFYLLRGGPDDQVGGTLPGPAPKAGDPAGTSYYEIPIVIQDRSFKPDCSLFYPDNRAYFEGLSVSQLQIPFKPDPAIGGESDVLPIWNPEFFGNVMVVNGVTWPFLEVEQRRYRLRFLNGCNARTVILKMSNDLPFWQIGSEGGFLPAPVELSRLLVAPAERADVIVDFTNVPVGTDVVLLNLGPDEPYQGGMPGEEFEPANPDTTGQVMQFRVRPSATVDLSTPADQLGLPALPPLGDAQNTRKVALLEEESSTVFVPTDEEGNWELDDSGNLVMDPNSDTPFGPTEGLLGITLVGNDGEVSSEHKSWEDEVTENPLLGSTEIWEIYNFTADAHPIHVHVVQFQVIERESMEEGEKRAPESWETGYKDTVIALPGEITRIKAKFDKPGRFVWHCHILEHEDNEMMRPYDIVT
jgi:spore coat protein A